MREKVAIIVSGGIGDCILGIQCASFLDPEEKDVYILVAARQEIYDALCHLFLDKYYLAKIDENLGENNSFLTDISKQNELDEEYDEVYYVTPDLLFRNPFAFDYKRYNTHPQIIKGERLLLDSRFDVGNLVYVGLTTSTKGYDYRDLKKLLQTFGEELPAYKFYFPNIKKWNEDAIDYGDLSGLPSNVIVVDNPTFVQSIETLKLSSYGIFTCNGPSHIAYQMGIPRLILDPQYNKLPWQARWKEDLNECISLNSSVADIVNIVKTNLLDPATTLIPRKTIKVIGEDANWTRDLIYKY